MTPFSNNEPYIKAGNSAANQEEYIEALELYLKAIQRDPKFKQSLKLNLYKCLNALGEEVDIDDFLPDAKEDRLNSWLEKIEIWISSNPELPRRKKVNLPATVKTTSSYRSKTSSCDASNQERDRSIQPVNLHQQAESPEAANNDWQTNAIILNQKTTAKVESDYDTFIDFKEHEASDLDLKVIAFFLPQFHPFPENDKWWGRGFTEWTNVTKAKPNFTGHYQPHLPIHNGFYDLRVPDVLREQAKLAKNYGIYGFNFYYYWFGGKVLMHKPLEILLENKDIDIHFCLTWANENWTRRWDGMDNEILIAQEHGEEDSRAFFLSLLKYFEDPRYIKVGDKPVLMIYRPNIIPCMRETVLLWRELAKEYNLAGIYIVGAQTFGFKDPNDYGFDAVMEFPPHTVKADRIQIADKSINPNFTGLIYDYADVANNACKQSKPNYKQFCTSMLSWDNTARKQNNSHIYANFKVSLYKQWLSNIVTKTYYDPQFGCDEKLAFVNAWNEWAEGAHLEPDNKFGYSYLQATYDTVSHFSCENKAALNREANKSADMAIILHLHHLESWETISKYLLKLRNKHPFDMFITVTSLNRISRDQILSDFPCAVIRASEERGRDILPFIRMCKEIFPLDYRAVCKIHHNNANHLNDTRKTEREIFVSLLSNWQFLNGFLRNNNLGIGCPKKYMKLNTCKDHEAGQRSVDVLANHLGISFLPDMIPSGSMYWFRPQALHGIENIPPDLFDIKRDLQSEAMPQAFERLVTLFAKSNDFEISANQ